ncbi:alpha/beta fold hydrolase [Cyanobium sp. ATX 6A2]|uniref:alpha/beta fold hydrolase n=1 Tax=Cyanobium sp. ATX 6A2 TaxID=2823700 RepID=UPI0020CBA18F|nr:alpha/beta fold hydrolase [Cyanobium sp. ATX 6A2]MCP9888654.1 alpha/beta fold hydrolase [Cyanobium sp. ATX 6A2]
MPSLCSPFRQRWPWIGPDLQTLRDTLRPPRLGPDTATALPVQVGDGELLVLRDPPLGAAAGIGGQVVLVHGLGGSAGGGGVRRLGRCLQQAGFGVWRLNLRGAGPGRPLAAGTYAAACNADLLPVLAEARRQAGGLPLLGVGLSLGGAVLLNAALAEPGVLDGLVAVSSPLDLAACAQRFDRPRNWLYQRWLLRGLIRQTLADPFGLNAAEREALAGPARPRSIRAFDAAITAPRWGYADVDAYYAQASALTRLRAGAAPLPPALLLHALDDPWVPAAAAQQLADDPPPGLEVLLSAHGGHNGFHSVADRAVADRAVADGAGSAIGSWADRRTVDWLCTLQAGAVGAGQRL